jgi:molecular chaperone Hsp33
LILVTADPRSEGHYLPDSRLYTFIDGSREFALVFFEGQRLIQDLALLHPIRGRGFAYFRDVVLSVQPMITFLKAGEQFGFYIDSVEPRFRLKIETEQAGATRCTLVPESFCEFPEAMHGIVRLLKLFPENRPPYESVLEAEGLPLREIVNRILADSFQTPSVVKLSQRSDQSLMLRRLPPLAGRDEYEYSPRAVRERRDELEESLESILHRALTRPDEVREAFAGIGFRLLASRPVRFRCNCSHRRMVRNVMSLGENAVAGLFDPRQEALEITCEYCKSVYRVTRDDLGGSRSRSH